MADWARKSIRSQLKELSNNKNIKITPFGDWICNLDIQFPKSTKLGVDLFCHALKFKTNNESLSIQMKFSSEYPNVVPQVRILRPRILPLSGCVTTAGTFYGIDILLQENWSKLTEEKKTISNLISTIVDSMIQSKARIDLRIHQPYISLQVQQLEERKTRQQLLKRPTVSGFDVNLRAVPSREKMGMDGDRIELPSSCAAQIHKAQKPIIFEIRNKWGVCYGGCGYNRMNFNAPSGSVVLPKWMVKSLGIKPGEVVNVRLVKLPIGKFVKFRPQSKEFYNIKDHKTTLENILTKFTTLTEGQLIPLRDDKKVHFVEVLELQPENAVCIDAGRDKYIDLVTDFAPAVDFDDEVELPKQKKPKQDNPDDIIIPPDLDEPKTGGGKKLGTEKLQDLNEQNVIQCENCLGLISKSKFEMHSLHCKRNIYRCKDCNITMPMSEKKLHMSLNHQFIKCECGQFIEKTKLKDHQIKCPERIGFCQYCSKPLNESQRSFHESTCEKKPVEKKETPKDKGHTLGSISGDSTVEKVKCEICERDVVKMNYQIHLVRCAKMFKK